MRDTPTPGDGDASAPRIGGRYRLGHPIGRGGMSTVHRAHDEQLDRPVALKRLRTELDGQHRFVTRFAGEARRAASISHPNVVALYDFGEDDAAPYIVMELVEGGDVAALVRREGRLEPERAARLVADAAAGLQAAHDAGVIHRDVKPGNILIGPDGRGMVTDFGIARATGEDTLTRTGAVLGSVDYFSPEQTRGERASPRSDIYALGVVLYELLTGMRPFRGDTPYATAVDRLDRPPPDPRAIRPDVPDALAEIAMRAMALSPDDRYPTPAAMQDALLAWAGTQAPHDTTPLITPPAARGARSREPVPGPVAAGRDGPFPAARSESRRRSARAWATGALLLALLIGGYLGGRLIAGDEIAEMLPEVIVGSPGGYAVNNPTATPQPNAGATDAGSTTATPEPAPATAVPQPTTAPTASPTATAAAVALAGPDDAVAAFYGHVVAERFDAAYALWSERMQATYPRAENLDGRFDATESITFDALYVASQSATDATVQANFTERYEGGSARQFIGYWRLVLADGRWLLNEPNY
jgi:eukaryotic-like serine/threonine-protein kinase